MAALSPGTKLGTYEIVEPIGRGGMGEVCRARDTKLGREVAIKVLPESLVEDAERLARFEREAKLLAALNHPGIATLYGLEEADGAPFLVMELVEGETLAERIARGPIPLDEALPLFEQIADALEAAHDKGIIHRDLKPANVKITPDGNVKVLDFGLAKAFGGEEVAVDDGSQSPTLTKGTALGTILGTASYMSPEQARGKTVDKRTDVWAFGCCLSEALTGRKAFDGETATDAISAVMRAEPAWDRLPTSTPAAIRKLLRRALSKDRKERLADIADARLEIRDGLSRDESSEKEPPRGRRLLGYAAAAVLAALIAGLAVWDLEGKAAIPTTRVVITLPEGQRLVERRTSPIALSPDGRRLVYAADTDTGRQLYMRELDTFEPTPIAGTEGGHSPFFSPDGTSIGFFTDESLKKLVLGTGMTTVLASVDASSSGGSWSPNGTIVYAPSAGSEARVMKVLQAGGTPNQLVDRGFYPQVLPDGTAVLYSSTSGTVATTAALSPMETGTSKTLPKVAAITGGFTYLPTGHLVYPASVTSLAALPYDLESLEPQGEPVHIVEGVLARPDSAPYLATSSSGTLAYVRGSQNTFAHLVTVDRAGRAEALVRDTVFFHTPRFSPDGSRIAYDTQPGLWIYEIATERRTRLTGDMGDTPGWSPDGSRIVFGWDPNLYWMPSDGSRDAEILLADGDYNEPSYSADGRFVAYSRRDPETSVDIWILSAGDGDVTPFLVTPDDERAPRFSPDGRFIVYQSDESGKNEIYVRSFPEADRKWKVSADGGMEPVWSSDGSEIFYRERAELMVVDVVVDVEETLRVSKPRLLISGDYRVDNTGHPSYDVSSDGQTFVMIQNSQATPLTEIHVVLNWFSELERLVPAR